MKSFCKIYASGSRTIEELNDEIAKILNLNRVSGSFSESDVLNLWIKRNDEFDSHRQFEFPDGFLYFEYIFEFDFTPESLTDSNVAVIGITLNWLWKKGIAAVASCDYENLLPERGGYKNKLLPWPG